MLIIRPPRSITIVSAESGEVPRDCRPLARDEALGVTLIVASLSGMYACQTR